jgi:Tol biopolymer transport system component
MPDAALIDNPTISPDGSRIVVDISDEKANNIDLWFINSSLSTRSRFTFNPEEEEAGVWSRDGTRLAYRAGVSYGTALFLKPASGLEREHRLLLSPLGDDFIPTSWSADDKQILCTLQTPTSTHLALVPAAGESFVQIAAGPGDQNNGQISPDGKWVAYASNESGNWEIYAMTFPGAAGRWQISRNGGTEPRWSGDGKEIFFLGPRGMVMAASVESRTAFSSSTPVPQLRRRQGRKKIRGQSLHPSRSSNAPDHHPQHRQAVNESGSASGRKQNRRTQTGPAVFHQRICRSSLTRSISGWPRPQLPKR